MERIQILSNARGGNKISILKTGDYQKDRNLEEKCKTISKGLYIWTIIDNIQKLNKNEITNELRPYIITEGDEFYFIQKPGTWVKPGQFGKEAQNGIKPMDTIDNYFGGQSSEVIILDVYNNILNPMDIEKKAWHQNPIFSSRTEKNGYGFERITAPISEIRYELNKIIGNSVIENFREKNISIDIRNDLFHRIVKTLSLGEKSTLAYILHMRFAKTGFTLELVNQLGKFDKDLVFILFADDYTVYGSYRNWIEEKKCWGDNIKYIDSGRENVEEQIKFCRNNNIIPFIKVGSKVNDYKIEYLKNIQSNKKVLFVEEADFGAWTHNNREKSKSLDSDIIILESGTGINKVSYGKKIDHLFILDLLDAYLIKRGLHPNKDYLKYKSDYINFPDVKFYDINFSLALQTAQSKMSGDMKTSLNKIFRNVDMNRDFILSFFKTVFCIADVQNKESFGFINKRQNSFGYKKDIIGNVSVVYLSPGISNLELDKLENLLLSDRLISDKFEMIILNGDLTTRENSERQTKGWLNQHKGSNKSFLIIAANMGKRSFSIPQIKNVFLMYDSGSDDGTNQIIARGLTEGYQLNSDFKQYYNVIGCSINPNRIEPSIIDLFIIDNIAKAFNRFNLTTDDATSLILGCFPLSIIDENGIEFNSVDYKDFIKRNPKGRMYINAAKSNINLDVLPDDVKEILEKSGLKQEFISEIKSNKLDLKDLKTKLSKKKRENSSNKNDDKKEIDDSIKILEALVFLVESSFNIKFFSDYQEKNFSIIKSIDKVIFENLSIDFKKEFGIEPEICKFVIETGVIDEKLINAGIDEIIIEISEI